MGLYYRLSVLDGVYGACKNTTIETGLGAGSGQSNRVKQCLSGRFESVLEYNPWTGTEFSIPRVPIRIPRDSYHLEGRYWRIFRTTRGWNPDSKQSTPVQYFF
jgi:hypothetical protein